jgi:hypothetical protein
MCISLVYILLLFGIYYSIRLELCQLTQVLYKERTFCFSGLSFRSNYVTVKNDLRIRTKPCAVAWSRGGDSVQSNSFLHTVGWRRQTSVFQPALLSSQGRKDTVLAEEPTEWTKYCTSRGIRCCGHVKFPQQRRGRFYFLGHYALYFGTYVLMFWRELSLTSLYFPEDGSSSLLQNSDIKIQWRTQEFFSGEGGSANSVEDRGQERMGIWGQ